MPDMNRQEMLKNDIFNPAFAKGFAMWSRHGDVEVTEWPQLLPDDTFVPARTWLGNAAALAPRRQRVALSRSDQRQLFA